MSSERGVTSRLLAGQLGGVGTAVLEQLGPAIGSPLAIILSNG